MNCTTVFKKNISIFSVPWFDLSRKGYLIFFLILFLHQPTVFAGQYLTTSKKKLLLQAQTYLFNDQFSFAHRQLDSLIKLYPNDPIGYLFQGAVCLAQMIDQEDNLNSKEFARLMDTAIFLAKDKIDTTNRIRTSWRYYCLGQAHAYKSLWESKYGSFTSAIKSGREAKSEYEKGLQYDSTLYDLYGGLGMYHYWKSVKAGILRWLHLFKNEKQKGINELYLTLDSSSISKYSARNALIWIWMDKKVYDSVITISQEMLSQFPEGKIFLWPLAKAYYLNKDYTNALDTYLRLRERLLKSPGNYYNIIECDYSLYQCYDKLKRKDKAKQIATNLTQYYQKIPKKIRWRQRSKLAFLKRMAK